VDAFDPLGSVQSIAARATQQVNLAIDSVRRLFIGNQNDTADND